MWRNFCSVFFKCFFHDKKNYFESLPLLKQTAWVHPWGNFQNNFLIELMNHTFCKLLKIHSVKVKLNQVKKHNLTFWRTLQSKATQKFTERAITCSSHIVLLIYVEKILIKSFLDKFLNKGNKFCCLIWIKEPWYQIRFRDCLQILLLILSKLKD